jgi:hypothetical protein
MILLPLFSLPSLPPYRLKICINLSMIAIKHCIIHVQAFCCCPCLRPWLNICRIALNTARIKDPKQMEPNDVVADLENAFPTTPLFSPLYHQSATMPDAEQNTTFFTTRLPQKREIKRRNRMIGEILVVKTLRSVHTPGVVNSKSPSVVVRAQTQLAVAPAAAVAGTSRHSDRKNEVPSMTTTSAPLLIATPNEASCHIRDHPTWTKVKRPARKRMEG